jgi:2'-hydroxyisoflavone reductase
MHLLILGGTAFLGRHLVAAAQERGHTLTLLHRGTRDPFPALENLIADRTGALDVLDGRRFDAVIDTSGYVPGVVRASAEALASSVGRYCFISTISVYPDMAAAHDEDTPLPAWEGDATTLTPGAYGPLKALCEEAVREVYGDRALILRPGLIVGEHDPSDRFTYWVERVARGGRVAAPGDPARGVQFIDALSLARFTIAALESSLSGTFNTNGAPISMGDMLNSIVAVSESGAELVWIDEETLAAQEIAAWMGPESLPVWAPGLDAFAGATDSARAVAAGLRHRPLEEVVREVLAFARSRGADHAWRSGLSPAREAALLAVVDGDG